MATTGVSPSGAPGRRSPGHAEQAQAGRALRMANLEDDHAHDPDEGRASRAGTRVGAGQREQARRGPDGEHRHDRARGQWRAGGQGVDLDRLGEAARQEERGDAQHGGAGIGVAGDGGTIDAEAPARPLGRVGDHAATRGERPVSRTPMRVMRMATTTMSTATSIDGIATVAPTAPSRAPRTAKPTIRPTMKTALGRRR